MKSNIIKEKVNCNSNGQGTIPAAMRMASLRGLEILPEKATGKEKGTTRGQVFNYFAKSLIDNSNLNYEQAKSHMQNWDSK